MSHQTTSKSPLIQGFRVSEPIGGGAFSKVYRAQHTTSGDLIAVKVIPYAGGALDQRLLKEVKVHSALKNANVLEVLGSEVDQDGSRKEWGIGPAFFILLEFAAGGDLFDKIAPDYGVSEDLAHFFFYQLLSGLNYIHLQGVAHRDLKPENLLLDGMGNLKISDFGLCSVFRLRDKERKLNDACGSPPYAAPELAYRQPYTAEPIDVWSAGVVLFTLLVGNTPWDQPTNNSPEFQAYLNGELLHHDPWTRLSSASLSLLKKILNVDPTKRLTIRQITQHRWFIRPSYYLNEQGQCRNPARLANDLLTGLKDHGFIEQAANQAAAFNMEDESEDAMDVDGDMFQASQSQSQAMRSQRKASNQEPIQTAMTGYSQASKAAPSQRGNTAFNFVVSLSSLESIRYNILRALQQLKTKNQFNGKWLEQPLQPGDIDERDQVPGGDGFILSFTARDNRSEEMIGWIRVLPEFDSPLLEELAQRNGIDADKAYIVKFDRGKGNPMSFRSLHKAIVDACPPELLVAR